MRSDDLVHAAEEKVRSFGLGELRDAGLIPVDGSYFPAIYYPPIPRYPRCRPEEVLGGFTYDAVRPFSLYLHIPFCVSRCTYCHWVVHVGSSAAERDRYLDGLAAEMALYAGVLGVPAPAPRSVLIGGGTPSTLTPGQTERLLALLGTRFDLSRCTQITCELEPTTVLGAEGLDKLRVMKALGVNRVSLGVQSFHDRALAEMGRHHSAAQALEAIAQIRRAGIESLSLDLIYGYPGCTPREWLDTLETAFSLDIDACQLYRLRIVPHGEREGAVKARFDRAPAAFPDVPDVYTMKALGILAATERGFPETSRRVFARGARHNSDYLTDHTDSLCDVLGLGISSWSNLQGRFFVNTGESLEAYYGHLAGGALPIAKGKVRTEDDQRRWAVAVPLKHHGVRKAVFRQVTGADLGDAFPRKIQSLKRFGLLWEEDDAVGLTEKGGFLADEAVIQFYHPDYIPFPASAYRDGELNPYRP